MNATEDTKDVLDAGKRFQLEDLKRAREELQEKLKNMTQEERWLSVEGFTSEPHRWLQVYLGTEAGRKIIVNVLHGSEGKDNVEITRDFLRQIFAAAHADGKFKNLDRKTKLIDQYVDKYRNGIEQWYIGIAGDGDRALRTVHLIFKSYLYYDNREAQPLE